MRLTLKLCLTKFQPGKKIPLQAPSRSPTIQGANLAVTEAEAIMFRTSWRRLFRALRSRFRRAQWAQLPRRRPTQSNSKGMMQIWATTRRDIRAHAATVTHPLPSRTKVQLAARQEIKCRTRLSRGLRYSFAHKSSATTAMQKSQFVRALKQSTHTSRILHNRRRVIKSSWVTGASPAQLITARYSPRGIMTLLLRQ